MEGSDGMEMIFIIPRRERKRKKYCTSTFIDIIYKPLSFKAHKSIIKAKNCLEFWPLPVSGGFSFNLKKNKDPWVEKPVLPGKIKLGKEMHERKRGKRQEPFLSTAKA